MLFRAHISVDGRRSFVGTYTRSWVCFVSNVRRFFFFFFFGMKRGCLPVISLRSVCVSVFSNSLRRHRCDRATYTSHPRSDLCSGQHFNSFVFPLFTLQALHSGCSSLGPCPFHCWWLAEVADDNPPLWRISFQYFGPRTKCWVWLETNFSICFLVTHTRTVTKLHRIHFIDEHIESVHPLNSMVTMHPDDCSWSMNYFIDLCDHIHGAAVTRVRRSNSIKRIAVWMRLL